MNFLDPFGYLGSTAGKLVADSWTALMVGLWNAGLWLLRLALSMIDGLLTPDLSGDGPGAAVYRVALWLALTLVVILGVVQVGLAVLRRDGRVLARAGIGLAQFVAVWAGWLGYGITLVIGCSGLSRAMMGSLLNVDRLADWQPWQPFTPSDISDGTIATVLGVMGIFLILAAIGHLLAMLARAAALIVLAATTPIASAGLVSDFGRAWFWKSLRWFHAAALAPVLMVLVMGIGIQFATGVATGLTGNKLDAAIGTAVPGVLLICVAAVSPMALFKLLAFVDPGTTSGAAMRASLAASGGLQGLLNSPARTSSDDDTSTEGASSAEGSADQATTARFATAAAGGMSRLGPVGQGAAVVLGAVTRVGAATATMGADLTNQMEVGHNTYPPDSSWAARRATSQNGPADPNNTIDMARSAPPAGGQPPASAPGAGASPAAGGAGAGAAAPAAGEAASLAVVAL